MPDEIRLVQDFLRTEISPEFELIAMLGHGVHHAGLSDEIKTLMEWLAEAGHLRALYATSTIAQGINFPVSSIFLASRFVPQDGISVEMSPREFWNLVGRAGRIGQDSVGVVGLAEGENRRDVIDYVGTTTGALASRLVAFLDDLEASGRLNDLQNLIYAPKWVDFRCYVAHLWAEKKNLDAVLTESEQLLRQTYGYTVRARRSFSNSHWVSDAIPRPECAGSRGALLADWSSRPKLAAICLSGSCDGPSPPDA